jgi:diguanylate cyclase (GGDEF)-like protein/PAS domain S-box-containing protein
VTERDQNDIFGNQSDLRDRPIQLHLVRRDRTALERPAQRQPLGLAHVSLWGEVLWVNGRLAEIWGVPAEKLVSRPLTSLVAGFDRAVAWHRRPAQDRANSHQAAWEQTLCRPDNSVVRLRFTSTLVRLPDAADDYYMFVVEDLTERLRPGPQQLIASGAFDQMVEGLVVADADGVVQSVNSSYTAITGYTPEETLGRGINLFRSDRIDSAMIEELWDDLSTRGVWSGEYWTRRKNGEAYPEWLTVTVVKDRWDRVRNYVCLLNDTSQVRRGPDTACVSPRHDPLTGLPNRLLALDRLEAALAAARRRGGTLAVLAVDLDDFRQVNDSLGHEAGDLALREAARRLADCGRDQDTLARWGGDEFLLILPDLCAGYDPVVLAGRIHKRMNRPFDFPGRKIRLGVTIGIAAYPADGQGAAQLIRRAHQAACPAK